MGFFFKRRILVNVNLWKFFSFFSFLEDIEKLLLRILMEVVIFFDFVYIGNVGIL